MASLHTAIRLVVFPSNGSGNTPVLNIFQPVTKTAFSYAIWNPVDCVIVANQVVFYCCHSNEPGLSCIVDKRCITSPTVWIIMCSNLGASKTRPFSLNPVPLDLHLLQISLHKVCLSCHVTFSIYELYKWKVVFSSNLCIILTKCRCNVYNTCTIAHCYIGQRMLRNMLSYAVFAIMTLQHLQIVEHTLYILNQCLYKSRRSCRLLVSSVPSLPRTLSSNAFAI